MSAPTKNSLTMNKEYSKEFLSSYIKASGSTSLKDHKPVSDFLNWTTQKKLEAPKVELFIEMIKPLNPLFKELLLQKNVNVFDLAKKVNEEISEKAIKPAAKSISTVYKSVFGQNAVINKVNAEASFLEWVQDHLKEYPFPTSADLKAGYKAQMMKDKREGKLHKDEVDFSKKSLN